MGKKERDLAAQDQMREMAGRHWQVARTLAHDLMEGGGADGLRDHPGLEPLRNG